MYRHNAIRNVIRTIVRTAALLTLVSLLVAAFPAAPVNAEVAPKAGTCKTYTVKISGNVNGSAFTRSGRIAIYTPGITAANKQEMWLVSGNPGTAPSKGAIRVTSNSFFTAKSSYSANKVWMGSTSKFVSQNAPTRYLFAASLNAGLAYSVNMYTFGTTGNDVRYINYGTWDAWVKGTKVEGEIRLWDKYKSGKYEATYTGNLQSTTNGTCKFNNY